VLGFLILFNAVKTCSLRRRLEFSTFFIGTRECSRGTVCDGRPIDEDTRKGKGCDIGYALAISSCEGANNVEACTVTALDAITAFAVPNPNYSSQSRRFFQVWLLAELITQPASEPVPKPPIPCKGNVMGCHASVYAKPAPRGHDWLAQRLVPSMRCEGIV
jgi:hypothetical protein